MPLLSHATAVVAQVELDEIDRMVLPILSYSMLRQARDDVQEPITGRRKDK